MYLSSSVAALLVKCSNSCAACEIRLQFLKKNQNTPRPSEHPPVMGEKMSKRLGGIKRLQIQNLFMALNRFPDADNIGSTV